MRGQGFKFAGIWLNSACAVNEERMTMQRHRTPLRHALVLTPKLLLLVQPPLERLLLLP